MPTMPRASAENCIYCGMHTLTFLLYCTHLSLCTTRTRITICITAGINASLHVNSLFNKRARYLLMWQLLLSEFPPLSTTMRVLVALCLLAALAPFACTYAVCV